jgi:lipocalin
METAIGEARFVNSGNEARLKVSFFKPFWAGYNVIDLDDDYKYALVAGNNLNTSGFSPERKPSLKLSKTGF